MAEQSVILAPGESKVVAFEVSPSEARAYHVEVNGLSGSFVATEAPELVTFSVRVSDIPSYAADAYQWFILYGGQNWGMIDPQGGVWTPIDEPITVTGPAMGTLSATLHAGPFKSWEFRAGRKFESGKEYTFQLAAGILASGVALTNLTVEPDFIYQGASTTISVTAINSESEDQSYEIVFKLDDSEVGREIVNLGPLESRVVSVVVTPSEARRYHVTVETLSAWLDVKEPYPDISEPELVSIRWVNFSELTFEGKIILPRPKEGELVGFTYWLEPEGTIPRVGSPDTEYISGGIWSFSGKTALPYSYPYNICVYGYRREWTVKCPLCSYWSWTAPDEDYPPQSGLEVATRHFVEHIQRMCARGNTGHCSLTEASGIVSYYDRPLKGAYTTPCPGTAVSLTIRVIVVAPTGGDPPYALVNEWLFRGLLPFTMPSS